jgi:hypothetical protein
MLREGAQCGLFLGDDLAGLADFPLLTAICG